MSHSPRKVHLITMPSPAKVHWLIKGEGHIKTSPEFKKFMQRVVTIHADGNGNEGKEYALREEISKSPLLKEVASALVQASVGVSGNVSSSSGIEGANIVPPENNVSGVEMYVHL